MPASTDSPRRRPGAVCACILLWLLAVLPGAVQPVQAGGFDSLFGATATQRPRNIFVPWLEVQVRNQSNDIFSAPVPLQGELDSMSLLQVLGGLSGMQRLRFVNAFWNAYPYIADIKNWRKNDYWAIPAEFVRKSGDCEDYAIAKFYTLRAVGVPDSAMRIVVLRDVVRNLAHAVLAVEAGGEVYILDNISSAVVPHSALTQYVPAYSLNEQTAWVHMKTRAR